MLKVRQTETFANWHAQLRDRKAYAKITVRSDRMSLGNLGDVSPVGAGVSEARIHYGPGYRLYFCRQGEDIVILLAGGDKSTQSADIAKAIQLKTEL